MAGHIPRPASEIPRPVSVITRRDIELSGAQNVRDLLLSRLDFNSFGLYRPFVAGGGRLVILVNGRRVSYSGFDAEAFPLSAVERIEILSDSAAALHGGHAIGGAINIVLRRDFKGVEVQAGAARPRQAGADSEQGSFVWGGALGRGRAVIGRRYRPAGGDTRRRQGLFPRFVDAGRLVRRFAGNIGGRQHRLHHSSGREHARAASRRL